MSETELISIIGLAIIFMVLAFYLILCWMIMKNESKENKGGKSCE